jgi:hypothetical protein
VSPMRRLLVLLTTLLFVPAATANADGGDVIRDCTDDGRLNKRYSQSDLRDALSSIPSDVDEYTNCRDVIRRAAFRGAGASGGGGGGGSGDDGGSPGGEFGGFGDGGGGGGQDPAASATKAERDDLDRARREGGDAIRFSDGTLIRPGAVARRTASGTTDVPAPLVVAAILLAAAALAAATPTVRDRVLPRRGA